MGDGDAEGSGFEGVVFGVLGPFHLALGEGDGDEDGFALVVGPGDEVPGAGFFGFWEVGEDGLGVADGGELDESLAEVGGLVEDVLGVDVLAFELDGFSEGFFGFHVQFLPWVEIVAGGFVWGWGHASGVWV